MKVIKPLRLSVLNRPYRWQEKNHLGVSVLALADMGNPPHLRPESELWQLAENELKTSGGVVDLAIPKACAEFLATGYAYTQHQEDKTACAVRIQVEQREKTLVAFGERHWVNNTPSSPSLFNKCVWTGAVHSVGQNTPKIRMGSAPVQRHLKIRKFTACPISNHYIIASPLRARNQSLRAWVRWI
ncbi:Uncharacterized protein conserved in bacteria [Serratia fonticola]|uniref:Uncharacterized protein conserved in bacteria n=1 Tax=Serratia fonticola TaxID=47917 RepID=A0A3S4WKW0_SERFO|nr:Uncharacterized protein conserved in bacteria [Serratia fonticola]